MATLAEIEYPEGRRRAWSTLIGASLMQVCATGILYSYGVFQDYYLSEWLSDYSPSTISWIGSVQVFLQLALGPVSGEILDRGYFKTVVVAGSSLYVLSLFLLSFTRQNHFIEIFLAQAIGMGVGVGLIYLPISVVPIRHFTKKQSLSMGIVDGAVSLGGVIFSIALNALIYGHIGFKWGIRVISLITLICFAIGIPNMSMPKTPHSVNPESSTDNINADSDSEMMPSWKNVLSAAKNDWPFLFSLAQVFVVALGTYIPPFYLQVFVIQHNIDKKIAMYALAVLNLSSMFGRIVSCYYGDMYSALAIYAPCVTITGGLCFAMLGATNTVGLFSFAICYGFFNGATNALYLPLVNQISYRRPTHLWKRCGISLVFPAISSLVGPPIAGIILGADLVWWKGITFASVTITSSAMLIIVAILIFRQNERRYAVPRRNNFALRVRGV